VYNTNSEINKQLTHTHLFISDIDCKFTENIITRALTTNYVA